jgi:hypothetical protein
MAAEQNTFPKLQPFIYDNSVIGYIDVDRECVEFFDVLKAEVCSIGSSSSQCPEMALPTPKVREHIKNQKQ